MQIIFRCTSIIIISKTTLKLRIVTSETKLISASPIPTTNSDQVNFVNARDIHLKFLANNETVQTSKACGMLNKQYTYIRISKCHGNINYNRNIKFDPHRSKGGIN